ncbi:MAG TPA: gliding motility-associated ABC transporter ATP-binding subunit GldA [Cytophagales bacterium]|nr:gliding motility-associated ABC transporter ATP-binding subunit GldA [Cytophagales bacterium]
MSVVVKDLVKIYGEQRAVDGVSFEAKKGSILGFLGPNGAGKSTTMKIATSYIPPTSGVVTVCGIDVVQQPIEAKKKVGYLPEHNPLYLDMYVHEYLQFVGGLHGLAGKKLKDTVADKVYLTGLTVEQNKKIGALSKGYRQRVGLAQALLHDPEVLILDEPTTGLDPNQIVEIRQLIKNIGREKTVIFSSHIMQEVQQLCDEVVIINKGKIVANSGIQDLSRDVRPTKIITVEFEREISQELLEKIAGIRQIERISTYKVRLKTESSADIRSEIFKWAAENQLPLVGLSLEESNMEDIFRELTGKKE